MNGVSATTFYETVNIAGAVKTSGVYLVLMNFHFETDNQKQVYTDHFVAK